MTLRPLLAYLPWHARDAAARGLAPVFLFALMAGLPLYGITSSNDGVDFINDPTARDFALAVYRSTVNLAIVLGAFLMTAQTVATDRERQHVRVLFAHQVVPWAYYLQRYMVGLMFMAISFVLAPWGFSQLVTPVPILGAVWAALATGILIGGLAMLCSAITARDALPLLIVFLGSNILQQVAATAELSAWLEWLAEVLPPVQKLTALSQAWYSGAPVPTDHLAPVLGYGTGMLILSLVIIKRAPLVR